MNEHQRMQYLDALGIESFVPRLLLPNAKPSVECVFFDGAQLVDKTQVAHDPSHAASTEAVAVQDPNGSDSAISALKNSNQNVGDTGESYGEGLSVSTLKSLKDGLSDVLSGLELDAADKDHKIRQPQSREKLSVTTKHSQANELDSMSGEASQREVPLTSASGADADVLDLPKLDSTHLEDELASFNLGLWFTDTGIQVVDSREALDALPTESLLSNILIATGLLRTNLAPVELQRWPIPDTQLQDQSWRAASSMLFDFLTVRFEKSPASSFILFGESAYRAICKSQQNYQDVVFQTASAQDYGLNALILPSLRELLYEPLLKRQLWVAIKSHQSQI